MDLSHEEQRRTVISCRLIDAPVDAVFDAYANSEKLVRWWGPNGFMLTTESLDLHEGGHWRFVSMGPDGTTYKNHLVFAKVERPHLFVVDKFPSPSRERSEDSRRIGPRATGGMTMPKHRIFATPFASVYPLYVQKAERKNRTKEEIDQIICCTLSGVR